MAFDWGALIGAGASLWAADKASKDAKKAGQQSAAGAEQAINLSRDIYNDQRALNMPAYNDGNAARAQYMRMLGLTPSDASASAGGMYDPAAAYLAANPDVAKDPTFGSDPLGHYQRYGQAEGRAWGQAPAAPQAAQTPTNLSGIYNQWRQTPGYQFGLQEGNRSIEASAAARGGLNSGATLKALQRYGTDYADQQGYRPYMNSLASLFGGAQQAVSNIGSAGGTYGSQAGNAFQNAGNARAGSTYDSANARQQGIESAWKYGNQFGQNQGWWG